jgi:hypothetical protein
MRILMLAFLLTSLFAQSPESPNRGPANEDPTANSSTPKTYQGCVVRSGGKIMLTDAQNRDYILVSSGRALDSYVGQEVQLSAISMNPNDPTSNQHGVSAQQPSGQPMTLDVENIQKIRDKCSSPKSTDKK